MGWYDNIQNVQVSSKGAKLTPGNYVLQVQEVKEIQGQNNSGTFFIVELKVLQSDNPAHPVGQAVGQVIRLDVKFADGPNGPKADVKAFAAAAMGISPANEAARMNHEIQPAVITGLLHETQPVRGHVLRANVYAKMPGANSKPGAQPFFKFNWEPILDGSGRPVVQALPPLPPRAPAPPQGQWGQPQGGFTQPGQQPQGQWGGAPQGPPPGQWGGPPAQAPQGPPPGQWGGPAQPHPAQAPSGPPQGQWGQPAQPPAQAPWQGQPAQPAPAPPGQPWAPQAPAGAPPWEAPAQAPAPQGPPAFPPPGWQRHPQDASLFWHPQRGNTTLNEGQLRAAQAAGQA